MSKKPAPLTNAAKIIDRFGGIRPMASKIDTPVTTVQGWKKRDVIPGTRRDQILSAARENNINIEDLASGTANTNNQSVSSGSSDDIPSASISSAQTRKPADDRVHDQLLEKMEENSKKTMVASAWIAVGLILLAAIVGFFLLYPGFQKKNNELETQSETIQSLQTQVDEVENRTGFLQKIVPENIQEKVESLQDQANEIQTNIQELSEKAGTISEGVIGKDAGPLSKRLTVIEEQLSGLSDNAFNASDNLDISFGKMINRVEKLENSLSGQQQLKDSMSQLQEIVQNLDVQNSTLKKDLETAQTEKEDGALGQTLEGVSNNDLKAAAMLIAFSQLRDSLNREAPFEGDLALLQKLAGKDNEELQGALERLAPHADSGVLTTGGLSQELKGLTGDIVFSSLKGEDVSLKEKAKARIHNMLQVEKDGEPLTGTATQVTVNKAQTMLDNGDIAGAIAELQGLDGQAAQTAQPFLQQAQASLVAEQAKKLLGDNILSQITSQLPSGLGSALPGGAIPSNITEAIPSVLPTDATGNVNINSVKEALEDTVPLPAESNVVTDKESGLSVLPRQSGFKGFSSGQ